MQESKENNVQVLFEEVSYPKVFAETKMMPVLCIWNISLNTFWSGVTERKYWLNNNPLSPAIKGFSLAYSHIVARIALYIRLLLIDEATFSNR